METRSNNLHFGTPKGNLQLSLAMKYNFGNNRIFSIFNLLGLYRGKSYRKLFEEAFEEAISEWADEVKRSESKNPFKP